MVNHYSSLFRSAKWSALLCRALLLYNASFVLIYLVSWLFVSVISNLVRIMRPEKIVYCSIVLFYVLHLRMLFRMIGSLILVLFTRVYFFCVWKILLCICNMIQQAILFD